MTDNVILKAEGLYYDLGTMKMDVNGSQTICQDGEGCIGGSAGSLHVQRKLDGMIGKVGVSFKLN